MKKFLLGASALLFSLVAGSAAVHAVGFESFGAPAKNKPALKVFGQGTFAAMMFNQKSTEPNSGKGKGSHFTMTDGFLGFQVQGKADGYGELEYELLLGLDPNPDGSNVDTVSILLRGEWGTLMLGNSYGAEYFMSKGPLQNVIGGIGGADGDYTQVVNRTTGAIISMQPIGRTKNGTKISYYTPRVYGVQAGLSFTPNARHRGEAKLFTTANNRDVENLAFDKNNISAGLNYVTKFSNEIELGLSVNGIWANTQQPGGRVAAAQLSQSAQRQKTKVWMAGIVLGYKHFEAGFEYIDNGKSHEIIHPLYEGSDAGKIYNFGVAYNIGVDKFSIGFSHTKRKLPANPNLTAANFPQPLGAAFGAADLGHGKTDVLSVSWDRKLAPGLTVFVEGDYFKYTADRRLNTFVNGVIPGGQPFAGVNTGNYYGAQSGGSNAQNAFVPNNQGHVVMAGAKVKF
jgi:outer membrane protein OmpU